MSATKRLIFISSFCSFLFLFSPYWVVIDRIFTSNGELIIRNNVFQDFFFLGFSLLLTSVVNCILSINELINKKTHLQFSNKFIRIFCTLQSIFIMIIYFNILDILKKEYDSGVNIGLFFYLALINYILLLLLSYIDNDEMSLTRSNLNNSKLHI